jgi:signal transduction histidine kinase
MNGARIKSLLDVHFSESERAIKYKIVFLNSVFLLAGIVAFVLGFIRIRTSLPLGVIDFVFAALNFALLAYLNRHREKIEIVASMALTLSFLLFYAIYLLAPANPTRVSLFFLLSASAFFLKGRRVGRFWLAFIILSILAGHFIPAFAPGYSHFDTFTTCVYLIALFFIFENYETFKENQHQMEQEQEVLRSAAKQIRKLNEELELKVQDRTKQLVEAQEELVRKEKFAVLGQIAGSVGHELRNPLGVMNNAVYYLQTVLTDVDEATREYLNIIKNEIAGSERIVTDLLDSVRTRPPQPEDVGVAELIGQTLRKCSVPASVAVKLDIPAALPPLRVDAQQIHQVFRNLISNGVEAMPDGGALQISAAAHGKNVTVSVRDSGIGMTAEQLDKMFQPLYTTKARGIGLGLVVVKNLTEANGGTVEVQSEAGKGSVFSVTLPVVQKEK